MQPDRRWVIIYWMRNFCVQLLLNPDIAWKSGRIHLMGLSSWRCFKNFAQRFDREFRIVNPLLKKYCFTGTFINQRLDKILEHFKIASGWEAEYLGFGIGQRCLWKKSNNTNLLKQKRTMKTLPSINKNMGKNIALFPYKSIICILVCRQVWLTLF